jgi:hypothetical protein
MHPVRVILLNRSFRRGLCENCTDITVATNTCKATKSGYCCALIFEIEHLFFVINSSRRILFIWRSRAKQANRPARSRVNDQSQTEESAMADQTLDCSNNEESGVVRRSSRVRKPVLPMLVSSKMQKNGLSQKPFKKVLLVAVAALLLPC